MDESTHGIEGDTEWNTEATIRVVPDPRLSPEQQQVVEVDYGMANGMLEVHTRAKLVPYALKLLHVDLEEELQDPTAQQIVVHNRDEITPWLFG